LSSGVKMFSAAGDLDYSSTDATWNQVDFFSVAANGSTTKTYPVLSGRTVLTLQVQINAPPLTRKATSHTISASGTSVSVSGGSEAAYILVLMK
jgi:hypothetical protein